MCILSAIIGEGFEKEIFFKLLLLENSITNVDGTGIFNKHGYIKWDAKASDILDSTDINDWLQSNSHWYLCGHTRTTSVGKKSNGAHPFMCNNILLAHNGTIINHTDFASTDVDSHAICKALSKSFSGKEVTLTKINSVLENIIGSYALIVIDTIRDDLWFLPGKNPLYEIILEDGTVIINTSQSNVEHTIKIAKIIFSNFPGIKEKRRLPAHKAFRVINKKLVEVGDLAVEKSRTVITPKNYNWQLPSQKIVNFSAEFTKLHSLFFDISEYSDVILFDLAYIFAAYKPDVPSENVLKWLIDLYVTIVPKKEYVNLWRHYIKTIQYNPYQLGDELKLQINYPWITSDEHVLKEFFTYLEEESND